MPVMSVIAERPSPCKPAPTFSTPYNKPLPTNSGKLASTPFSIVGSASEPPMALNRSFLVRSTLVGVVDVSSVVSGTPIAANRSSLVSSFFFSGTAILKFPFTNHV